MVGQTAVALLMTLVVFGITCEGSIGLVIAVTLLQGVAGMCYGIILKVQLGLNLCLKICYEPIVFLIVILTVFLGFLLSTLFKEESTAMQAGVGSFYPLMMLSGILWPIEGIPYK